MITLATEADLNKILPIQHQLNLEFENFEWVKKKWVEGQIQAEQCYIYKKDGFVIGVMCLNMYGEIVQIRTLVIDVPYRKHGIGTEMVEFAKELWKKREELILHVGSFFEYDTYDFYVKLGFREESVRIYKGHQYYQFIFTDRD